MKFYFMNLRCKQLKILDYSVIKNNAKFIDCRSTDFMFVEVRSHFEIPFYLGNI